MGCKASKSDIIIKRIEEIFNYSGKYQEQVIDDSEKKVLFIYPAYENLGIEYLSAALKNKGYLTELLFDPILFNDDFFSFPGLDKLFSRRSAILNEVRKRQPTIIAFSIVSDRFLWAKNLATAIKSRVDTTIIAGGIHVTGAPKEVLAQPAFDYCIRGEGDNLIAPLARQILQGEIDEGFESLVYRKNGEIISNPLAPLMEDLDTLPFPDKEIFKTFNPGDMYTIMASRGCVFACSFCNNSLIKKLYPGQKPVRLRSVENVIAELEMAKARYSPKVINFLDEVFGAKPSWLKEFAQEYSKRIMIPFIACTHPAVESEKRVELMAKAGCVKVDMGVQTISGRLRKDILFRPETTAQVADAIKWYKKAGIVLFAENILGLPTETEQDQRKMVSFYNRCKPSAIKVFWLSYYPGTAITEIAEKHGIFNNSRLSSEHRENASRSIAQGGFSAKSHTKQLYLLLQILHLLPENWVDKILENQWYRFFPTFFVERFAYLVGRLTNRQGKAPEVLMLRYIKHYKTNLKIWCQERLGLKIRTR